MRSKLPWQAALATLAIALLTARGVTTGDDAVHLALAAAIVERGETVLAIDPGELWVPSRPLAGGLFYQDADGLKSASAPGLALFALPLVAIGSAHADRELALDALFRESNAPPETILRPIARDPRAIAFSLVGPLCAALAVLFTMLAIRDLDRRAQWVAACALALGSPLLAYAGTCWTQLPSCALVALMLWRLSEREARSGAAIWPLSIASALLPIVRPDHVVFSIVAGAALYLIERRWRRSPSRAMARLLVPLALAFAFLAWWGLPHAGDGFSIARVPIGALGLAISPRAGLFVYAPFAVLAVLAPLAPPIRMAIGAWIASSIIGYGGWFDWPASLAYGPRFLLPLLPALALALARAFHASARIRPLAWAACALGFAIQLPAALVAHVRIDEHDSFFAPAFVEAWRTFGTIDCTASYLAIYPALALVTAIAGIVVSRGVW